MLAYYTARGNTVNRAPCGRGFESEEMDGTMKHALVTGGAGFLGSHLGDLLLANGWRVTAMDNLITGDTANIAHNAGNPDFRFVRYDVTNYLFLPEKVDWSSTSLHRPAPLTTFSFRFRR